MERVNVMITGVGGGGVGEQTLKCLKMSRLNLNITGCDMNPTSRGLRNVQKAYIIPGANHPSYLATLLQICKKNDIQIIFPGSEPELNKLSENRDIFLQEGICLPINSAKLIKTCMDKNLTLKFLKENNFPGQKYAEINNEYDLEKIDFFPVVIKPSIGGGGSANTFIAQDADELLTFGKYMLKIYSQFTAQEYVGDCYNEYTVGVMSGADGDYINSIAVKKSILSGLSNRIKIKNRTGNKELGEILAISSGISQGEIGRFPQITEFCRRIAKALKATAPINIQGRLYKGNFYTFEINPRISGTSPLRAMVGYNEPEMLIRERILGEKLPVDFPYEEGYITRGIEETFISYDFMNNIENLTEQ